MERSPIAIIGFGCRYPGAASPHELWQNLVDGVESIGSPPPWRADHFLPGQKGGFVDDVDVFDASFFKISPQDAARMDPQQRLLLQLTWSALEDAGLDPLALRGSNTAVVVGVAGIEFAELAAASEDQLSVADYLGIHPSIPANRISQSFGFSGFSAAVNTACSSALVAVDLACRELWLQRSQLAIAAGVNLMFDPRVTQRFVNSGWLSARGQCRSLDATADGYLRSEGVGVAVLKPVEQALADGDRIYAQIQDCRIRHNGQGNGLALPCLQSQIDLLRDVYCAPGVDIADLHYVELNALGARVGDVIELKALAAAVGKQRRGEQPLKVGSLKPNIGHTEAASGMAGLIKTALALHHQHLPPTLHFQSCDPSLDLEALGLAVPTTLEPISPSAKPALAGISSFGFGGANAHILLAASRPKAQPPASSPQDQVLILSAASPSALQERCATLLDFVRSHPQLRLADISWTVNRSRSQLPARLAITAASRQQLVDRLAQALDSPHTSQPGVWPHQVTPKGVRPRLGFVFTGRCAFSRDVLAELALHHHTVAQAIDVAQRLIRSHWQDDPPPAISHLVGEVVLHQLWLAWGIEPNVCLAEPPGRAAAAVATLVAGGKSDLEAALQQLICTPDPAAVVDSPCPLPTVVKGEAWTLLQVGSAQVGSPAELEGLASPAAGAAWDILVEAAVRLAQCGVPVVWRKVCGSPHGRVVSLPTYPFARERLWLGEPVRPVARFAQLESHLAPRVPPSTELERQLHVLWAEVLGHSDFGISDNFFLVGGHSLAAARLVSRLEQAFGSAPPVAALFQHPTISGLLPLVVSDQGGAGSPAAGHAIPTAEPLAGHWPPGCQAFPASFAQTRLWFLHQLEPELCAYHLPFLWRLSGELDTAALRRALTELIERHPTLRTSFLMVGDEVVQLLHPPVPFSLETEFLPAPSFAARDGQGEINGLIDTWLEQEATTPFDLKSGLLLRARLLQVAEQEHLLLLNHHHIASDGWSVSVLCRDLVGLYNSHRNGTPTELRPLSVQYQDYAVWQRQRLSRERLQELNDYWNDQLRDLEPLELPSDHPRPATPSYRGGSVNFQIEPAQLKPFEALCRSEGATLQMGLLALLALLLHRYSRQEDFAIGVPIWGRNHPDLEPLIGFFVNTLPIRTRFDPELSFRKLLIQVKASSIGAYEHQQLPFEQILSALESQRDISRNPFYQVRFQLNEVPEASLEFLDGVGTTPLVTDTFSAQLDLCLDLYRTPCQGVDGTITFATDLFNQDRIQRLSNHLITLLDSTSQAPDAAISTLNLLHQEERDLIKSWQRGREDPSSKAEGSESLFAASWRNRCLRTCLMGDSILAVRCAEILQERGHEICFVIPTGRTLAEWAVRQLIPILNPNDDKLSDELSVGSFDLLLSFFNDRVLPTKVLATAKRWAINFHDSPLPSYAGLNAPSWALLNQESLHGVTWHLMTEGIDEGDILLRRSFPIPPGCDALQLQLLCIEAGVNSFATLLCDLEGNTAQGQSMEAEADRSHFGRYARPPRAGVLSLCEPLPRTAALIRSLCVDTEHSLLPPPVLTIGDELVWIGQVVDAPQAAGS
ncbi:MAG: condensation domain-containing protein, partial [Cyanobium sp.]